jgi:hypothetical protein
MKASEFINEGTMHDWHKQSIPGMKSLDGIGQYYDLYRFGLAMAAAGREEHPFLGEPDGVTEDNPTTLSYTEADEKIINAGLKRVGKTARQITSRLSAEPADTNTQSIIAVRKPLPRRT